jgi:hypothetical protein
MRSPVWLIRFGRCSGPEELGETIGGEDEEHYVVLDGIRMRGRYR